MNGNRYPGWAGVCSFDPDTVPVEAHVVADTLPDEIVAILALTPHVDETASWQEREAEAVAMNTAAAASMIDLHGWCFAPKHVNYEPDGDVIWA